MAGIGVYDYKDYAVVSLVYRCGCGKYNQGERFKGMICERCYIEVRPETSIVISKKILRNLFKIVDIK